MTRTATLLLLIAILALCQSAQAETGKFTLTVQTVGVNQPVTVQVVPANKSLVPIKGTTPFNMTLESSNYTVIMPYTVQSVYVFAYWSDGANSPERKISLDKNVTLTAVYDYKPVQPPENRTSPSPFRQFMTAIAIIGVVGCLSIGSALILIGLRGKPKE